MCNVCDVPVSYSIFVYTGFINASASCYYTVTSSVTMACKHCIQSSHVMHLRRTIVCLQQNPS